MTVAGLIAALQKLDPDAVVVAHAIDSTYLWPISEAKLTKAVCWSEGGNDPGMFQEIDAAGADSVVYIVARST